MASYGISLQSLIKRFWKKTLLTWVLVVLEGAALVAMPMAIGWAVDDLMNESLAGIFKLAGLCLFMLLAGAGRRFYDTRAYARIYSQVANELVEHEQKQDASLSRISARSNLFTEFIQFLEQSIPRVIEQIIGLLGTLVIIIFVDVKVFLACLASAALTVVIYGVSEKRIFSLNKGGNDELERQVDVFASKDARRVQSHFTKLMDWQIRLSDLETLNFSLIWVILGAVLVFSVMTVTSSGNATFGQIVSTVMYVFGFAEGVLTFPLYYQQVIRLREIALRLAEPQGV